MTVDLSTFNNSWYKPGSRVKRFFWYFINLLFFKSGLFPFYGLKVFLLKLFGAKIGTGVCIKPHVNIKYPWLLDIGNHVWIGENVWLDNLSMVTIGNHVCISQGALLLCGNHDYTQKSFDLFVKPIIINDGVWVGAKCIVFGGVICASHSVFAAGSHVSISSEAFCIYAGNPIVKIKTRIFKQ
jgi:putative colanic acid biosynthesis acetyltransferase WcaF